MSRSSAKRWAGRAVAVAAVASMASMAGALPASAVVKNINKLCAPHGGVAHVGDNYVECADGTVFNID